MIPDRIDEWREQRSGKPVVSSWVVLSLLVLLVTVLLVYLIIVAAA